MFFGPNGMMTFFWGTAGNDESKLIFITSIYLDLVITRACIQGDAIKWTRGVAKSLNTLTKLWNRIFNVRVILFNEQ